jgi:Mor family transcriptional regulator
MRWKEERNRKILAAHEAGLSMLELAHDFRLTVARIRVILIDERNKRSFSPAPYYRELRENQV